MAIRTDRRLRVRRLSHRLAIVLLVGGLAACATEPAQELALADMLPTRDPDATAEAPAARLFFEVGSSTLDDDARATLDALLADPARPGWRQLLLAGHTDRVGPERGNSALSKARAEAVRRYLVAAGVPETLIASAARGEREGLVATPDNTPEPQNRRVELYIVTR